MNISAYFQDSFELDAQDKTSLIKQMSLKICEKYGMRDFSRVILAREQEKQSAYIGNNAVLLRTWQTSSPYVMGAVAVSKKGVEWGNEKIHVIFMIIGNDKTTKEYVKLVVLLTRWLKINSLYKNYLEITPNNAQSIIHSANISID